MSRDWLQTWSRLTREQRVLLLGMVAIASIVLAGRVAPATMAWSREQQARSAELTSDLASTLRDLRGYVAERDSAEARRLMLGDELPSLLHGVTPTATSASLTEVLQGCAESAGIRLGRLDLRPDTSLGHFFTHPRVGVEVSGDVRGVSAFLAQLEANQTRIRVITIAISQSEPFAGATQPEALQASMVLEALGHQSVRASKITSVLSSP